jgi:hypothetical protein
MAIISKRVTCTTTATLIVAGDDANRQVALHAKGNLYIGGSDVTSSSYQMDNGDKLEITLPPQQSLYGITSAATSDITCFYSI